MYDVGVCLSCCARGVGIVGKSYNYKLVRVRERDMEQMGQRCGKTKLWCKKQRNRRTGVWVGLAKKKKKLKEDHVFREFENIVHVVGRRGEVRVWGWRT